MSGTHDQKVSGTALALQPEVAEARVVADNLLAANTLAPDVTAVSDIAVPSPAAARPTNRLFRLYPELVGADLYL